MMIVLILVLLGLLLVAGLIAYWVIEEKRDETWGSAPRPQLKHGKPRG